MVYRYSPAAAAAAAAAAGERRVAGPATALSAANTPPTQPAATPVERKKVARGVNATVRRRRRRRRRLLVLVLVLRWQWEGAVDDAAGGRRHAAGGVQLWRRKGLLCSTSRHLDATDCRRPC